MGAKRKLTAAFCAGGVTATLAAACAGTPTSSSVRVTAAQAYQATISASSAALTSSLTVTDGHGRTYTQDSSSGTFSWSQNQGAFTHIVNFGPARVITDEVIDGATIYTESTRSGALPGVEGLPTAPTGWDEATWANNPDEGFMAIVADGMAPGAIGDTQGDNPVALLGLLQAVASKTVYVDTQLLDGVATTHYRAIVPISKLEPETSEAESLRQLFGLTSVPFDYWIDSDHQLRMLKMSMTLQRSPTTIPSVTVNSPVTRSTIAVKQSSVSAQPVNYPVTLVLTDTLTQYGTPVHIVVPAAPEITSRSTCSSTADSQTCSGSGGSSPPVTDTP